MTGQPPDEVEKRNAVPAAVDEHGPTTSLQFVPLPAALELPPAAPTPARLDLPEPRVLGAPAQLGEPSAATGLAGPEAGPGPEMHAVDVASATSSDVSVVTGWAAHAASADGDRSRRLTFVVLGLAVLVGVAVTLARTADPHPAHRQLPTPIRDSVVLVPVGSFPADQATAIAAHETAEYGVPVTVAATIPIDPSTRDVARRQIVAERLVGEIAAAHPEAASRTLVIGLLTEDIYIAGVPDWDWAFGLRDGSGVAIVSTARMTGLDANRPWARLEKMVTRDIGFKVFGLAATKDPGDALYGNILSLRDLDRISDHL